MTKALVLDYKDVLIIFLIYLLAGAISSIFSFLPILFNFDKSYIVPITLLFNYILFFIIYYFMIMKSKNEIYNFKFDISKIQLIHFPIIMLFYLGGFLLSDVFVGLIPTEGPIFGKLYNQMTHLLIDQFDNKYINFAVVVLIAPICEELFFRGLVLKGLLNNSNISPVTAIIISALFFGGIHLFPWQILGGFIAGILFGIIFYKTGSLFYTILIHALNNLIAFTLSIYFIDMNMMELLSISNINLFIAGIILLFTFGFIYFRLTKNITWKSY